jgi:diguanylate cyclase (GGDEF)-like protein
MLAALATKQLSEGEMVIRRLHEIMANHDVGFDQQVRDLLALGCERFDLEIGMVSRIEGREYQVQEALNGSDAEIDAGQVLRLADTFCGVTVEVDDVVAFEHAAGSNHGRHRAYRASGLEAYIGIPLPGPNGVSGTLSFASPLARSRAFDEVDVDCIRLMGGWLSGELQRRSTEQELRRARKELEQLVRTDPLTELHNRRGITEALAQYARRSRFTGTALSAILVDIDDFKQVNDSHGHASGDRVIRAIAEGVRTCLRPSDVAARIGGDEFLVILPGASAHEACIVAERIAATVRCVDLLDGDVSFPVTVSIGVAEVPSEAVSVTDILVCTEALLRKSKRSGKDTVSVDGGRRRADEPRRRSVGRRSSRARSGSAAASEAQLP